MCVVVAGDEQCEDFGVSSGELHIVVPKNDVDETVVRVTFDDGSVAEELNGTPCNREILAYTDVMTFCYLTPAGDNNPQTGGQLIRFNLVIAQQSPQNRCDPARGGADGGVLVCDKGVGSGV